MDVSTLEGQLHGKVSILCHHNADPDAICSAYAIQQFIKRVDPDAVTEILYPDSASQLSDKIIARYSIEASKNPRIIAPETVVVVDVGSLVQLEVLLPILKGAKNRVFIDHHGRDPEIEVIATLYMHDEGAIATCEIVAGIWDASGYTMPVEVAGALLAGIVFDSKHLSIATPTLLRVVAWLMDQGGSLGNAWDLLQTSMDQSERIARLKSVQRMTLYRVEPWLVVTSQLGSFQASAARGMMNLGADVAIIAGGDKDVLKVSMRATDAFYSATGIHLGDDVAKPVGESFKGAGGGHATAAGVNGSGDAEEFLLKAVNHLAGRIGKPLQVL
jgi:nanoRNase/pAp phosphatase (c-di-AMP/oligoRNAs hydrolase)